MNDLVLDASLALQWFLEDETDRKYSLQVLASLNTKRAVVPVLWFYEVGNGLLMEQRRKRITTQQAEAFLKNLRRLPIDATEQTASEILELPNLARQYALTNYDPAYLALASRTGLPLATNDNALREAARQAGVRLF